MELKNRIFFTEYEKGPCVYWELLTPIFGINIFYRRMFPKMEYDTISKELKEYHLAEMKREFFHYIKKSFIPEEEHTIFEKVDKEKFSEISARLNIPEAENGK